MPRLCTWGRYVLPELIDLRDGELPRTRRTLLLRLLGSGRLLRDALADLAALPNDAWGKSVAASGTLPAMDRWLGDG